MDEDEWARVRRAEEANAAARPVELTGGLVTRPAEPWTATVHDFLRHLRSRGVAEVPEPLGIDGGRETLRLIEGESGGDGWFHQHTDTGLASAARLLRRVHDAGSDWAPPEDPAFGAPAFGAPAFGAPAFGAPAFGAPAFPGDPADEPVWCHGDPGPWNLVWRDQEAVGLIDWDLLHRGTRLDDMAYALRWFVPLRPDHLALDWHHFPEVPDRGHRVRVFLEAYGGLPAFDVTAAVATRMRATAAHVRALAERGVEPQRTWVADGGLEAEEAELAWLEERRWRDPRHP